MKIKDSTRHILRLGLVLLIFNVIYDVNGCSGTGKNERKDETTQKTTDVPGMYSLQEPKYVYLKI